MAILRPSAAMHHLLFNCLILLFSSYVSITPVYGAEEARDGFHSTPVSSLLPKDSCSAPAAGVSRGLPITPRYGPCSKHPGRPQPPSRYQISDLDASRIGFLNQISNPRAPGDTNGRSHTGDGNFFEDDGNFLVEVGFGTPQQKSRLLLDTGSSVTWTQCKSCVNCINGSSNFDPWASATYSFGSCIPISASRYNMTYADNSSSGGNYGCDTLILEPSDAFPKFQFGCGRDNKGDFGDGVDGLMGLGRGQLSLLSQTSSKYKNVFSYCLPTEDSIGSLLFGDSAMSQSSSLQYTPLVSPGSSEYTGFYFVRLLGISVANRRLSIPSSVFSSPGTIIDSGTVITRLPSLAYSALRDAFKEAMANYTLLDMSPDQDGDILDTCYDLSSVREAEIPEIVLHFGGETNVVLNGKSIIWGQDSSRLCLAFAGARGYENRLTIIGNRQQLSLTVLYDIQEGKIGFGNSGCAH